MKGDLKKEGEYELFETNHGHEIINLNQEIFFALVKGQQGDLIVRSNSKHTKDRTISKGKFYYIDFEDDPKFKDMPHLFLENGDHYMELILPEGLPNENNYQKKLVRPNEKLSLDNILTYIKGKATGS